MSRRIAAVLVALVPIASAAEGPAAGEAPALAAGAGAPAARPVPSEYRALARAIALPVAPSRDGFAGERPTAEMMAELHSVVLALNGIRTGDEDVLYVAGQARSAYAELAGLLEKVNGMPKPPGFGELAVTSFVYGFTGNFKAAYALEADAGGKQKAILAEAERALAAVEKADAAHLLLAKLAGRYAPAPRECPGRFEIDLDESWGGPDPYDWLRIRNTGEVLADCTVVVDLTGAAGETRRNVHFLTEWPADTSIYARYDMGTELLGRRLARTTVSGVKRVGVTVLSPTLSTTLAYAYEGAEEQRDAAERLKELRVSGRFLPFQGGLLWDTQPGVRLRAEGVEFPLPKCRVEAVFRSGSQAQSLDWEFAGWRAGEEKTVSAPKGRLTFRPTEADVIVSFPDLSDFRLEAQAVGGEDVRLVPAEPYPRPTPDGVPPLPAPARSGR